MNKQYRYGTPENLAFLRSLREELLNFGHRFPAESGASYYLGDDGTPWVDRPRETWITSRMAHVYSIGALLGHPGSAELADAALRGLCGELHDDRNGGWFPGVTADGHPLETKQCYAHAFVILAASSALLLHRPGAEALLRDALSVYDKYFWDASVGLAFDTRSTSFAELDPYRGINANMHTVEAFLAVADVTGRECYRERAGRIISHVIKWAEGNAYRIPEHFTPDWIPDLACNRDHPDDPFKPYGATPGHGLEWARLMIQWAVSSYPSAAGLQKPYLEAAEQLFLRAFGDGWNADGAPGFVYTTDWDGTPVVHDRMHWTLAEGINTASVLYRVTGKELYADAYAAFMRYLDETVRDHRYGSWFHQLDRENRPIGTVWPGKSDIYHALQATLIPYCDYSVSIAKGCTGFPDNP